jgi:pimeloyl-ACP methyl ester carboxylesterase
LWALTCACALVLLNFEGSHAAVSAAAVLPGCATLRPCDTLWVVNTRGLPCCNPQSHSQDVQFQVLDDSGAWQASDLASFLGTDDPAVTTVFWIHGNRYSSSTARQQGMNIYRALTRSECDATPIRYVIFSWPSARIHTGPIDDLRVKADRTNAQAYYLAWLIDQIDGTVPISLAGYSFGGRIATGAAHLLGDGMLCGWSLDERVHSRRLPMHVALLAPALDNHWLVPGHFHGNAMSQLAHLTVIYNSCDSALKRYRFLYGRTSDAQALGYTGVAGLGNMRIDRSQISQYDACCYVGKRHSWERYANSGALMSRLREAVLGSEAQTLNAGALLE